MEPSPSAAGVTAHSLLSLLAEGGGRTAALSLLHHRALQVTGGEVSLLFEPHPANGQMLATSGAGIDALPTVHWNGVEREAATIAQAFAGREPIAVGDLPTVLPELHAQLGTPSAILLPLLTDTRRIGLLAIGLPSGANPGLTALATSDVPAGFLVALELSRLRQREEFERDVRLLLDEFADRLATTLDLASALEPLCVTATRLFAGDRTTVWLHDRESRTLVPLASSDPSFTQEVHPIRADDPLASAAAAMRTHRAGLATSADDATSVLTVPLRGCRRALGTIVCEGVRIEPGDDIALLNRADELGRQLSSAVETTQLLRVVTQSRRELEQLFASIAHLIVVVDGDGRIVRANDAFAKAVGRAAETLRHDRLASYTGPEFVKWLDSLPERLEQPAVRQLTDTVLGGRFVVTVTDLAADARGRNGRVIVARDILSIQAIREREEVRSRLVQSEKLAALGQFVAGIGHELNNPLQSVLGHLELLRTTGAVPDTIKTEIRTIYRDAERAARIVRNLLAFAGPGPLQRRKTALNTILQKVLASRKTSCRSLAIEVVRHYDQQLPRIPADPLLLHQVFLNVVINAEQAVAATGQPGRIEITTAPGQDGWVTASVRDTGAGISDGTLPRIFEPFYTTRDVGQGTGLGLALAYGIVQEHGGRITAGNHPDGGAVFTVELPIA